MIIFDKKYDCSDDLQKIINEVPDNETILFNEDRYYINKKININRSINFDFNNSVIHIGEGLFNKGFYFQGNARNYTFTNGKFIGSGRNTSLGPIITSYSNSDIENYSINKCSFENMNYCINFNSVQGGNINALLSNCLFENILGFDSSGSGIDTQSGKAVAFSLNGSYGKSYDNVFINCERHSLYISNGGRFESINDSFYLNNEKGNTTYPLAALAIARGSTISCQQAKFYECRDAISLTSDNTSPNPQNVILKSIIIDKPLNKGIHINSGSFLYNNVNLEDITIKNISDKTLIPIVLNGYRGTIINNINMESNATKRSNYMIVYGYNNSSGLLLSNITMKGQPSDRGIIIHSSAIPRPVLLNIQANFNNKVVYT